MSDEIQWLCNAAACFQLGLSVRSGWERSLDEPLVLGASPAWLSGLKSTVAVILKQQFLWLCK